MTRYFATYFDRNYLPRALALYSSLAKHAPDFKLFALCMDDQAYEALQDLRLSSVTPIRLAELERSSAALLATKDTRTRVEYYYTCGPTYLLYILDRHREIDLLTYLDADLFFFSDLEPLFDELRGKSVGIIEHRFSAIHASRKQFGIYNVGWISIRNDENGTACLRWWSERCIEWCYDRIEGDKFADQKYLDQWPRRFQGVRVIENPGANVAPWNIARHRIEWRDNQVLVDGRPLVFFHFHGFKELTPWLFNTNLGKSGLRPSKMLREKVFGEYIAALRESCPAGNRTPSIRKASNVGIIYRGVRWGFDVLKGIANGAYILAPRAAPPPRADSQAVRRATVPRE